MISAHLALTATVCLVGQLTVSYDKNEIQSTGNVANLVVDDIDQLTRKYPDGPWKQLVAELKLHELRIVDETSVNPETKVRRFASGERPRARVVYTGPKGQQHRLIKLTTNLSGRCLRTMTVKKDEFGITAKTFVVALDWEGSLLADPDADLTIKGYGFRSFQTTLKCKRELPRK
jgi:hypothetical protein